jgi:hypothetical protein
MTRSVRAFSSSVFIRVYLWLIRLVAEEAENSQKRMATDKHRFWSEPFSESRVRTHFPSAVEA